MVRGSRQSEAITGVPAFSRDGARGRHDPALAMVAAIHRARGEAMAMFRMRAVVRLSTPGVPVASRPFELSPGRPCAHSSVSNGGRSRPDHRRSTTRDRLRATCPNLYDPIHFGSRVSDARSVAWISSTHRFRGEGDTLRAPAFGAAFLAYPKRCETAISRPEAAY